MAAAVGSSILACIGNTPLVRLNHLTRDLPADVLLKLEAFNPYCSVKDRLALALIEDAERSGPILTIIR